MTNKPVVLGPWAKGINNKSRAHELPKNSVRDALNYDFTDSGFVRSREGYSQTDAVDNGHSLSAQGSRVFLCNDGSLSVIVSVNPLVTQVVRSGLPLDPISYAELGDEVWWSNGTDSGRCEAGNVDAPWSVPTPDDIPLAIAGVGTMLPGAYRIAISHTMANGEESATSEIYSLSMPVAGSIIVTLPLAKPGTDFFRVYCSVADGSVLKRYGDVSAASGSMTITADPQGMSLQDGAFLAPLPPGNIVAFHNGRLLSASGNELYYSQPYNFGLCDLNSGWLRVTGEITIVAPCEGGVFVVADKTWFYAGNDIAESVVTEVLPFGAVRGTAFRHPDSRAVGWFSKDGFVIGKPDGSVTLPQRENGFSVPSAQTGATWVRTRDGETHLVCSLDGTAAYGKDVSPDFTTARMRYDDDSTTVAMNLSNGASSRYNNWYFTGFAKFNGDEYGLDDVGLSLLEGSADDVTPIQTVLDVGKIGLQSLQIKTPDVVYVSSKSQDRLIVTIALENGDTYDYPARDYSEDDVRVHRHDGMKGLMNRRQTRFDVAIRNDPDVGGRSEIADVSVIVHHSARKI